MSGEVWPDLSWCQAGVAESASVESPINTFHTNLYTEPTIRTPTVNDLARQSPCTAVARARGHSRGGGGR
jgi:hypothetical protein